MFDEIIVSGGSNSTSESDSAFERLTKKIGGGSALDDIYDRMMWLEYMFDISGSMQSTISRYSEIEMYVWTPKILAEAKQSLLTAQQEENEAGLIVCRDYDADVEDDVKQAVVDQVINIPLPDKRKDWNAGSQLSKIQIARKCAKNFLEKRYAKYPDARVGIATFESCCREICAGQDKKTTFSILDPALEYANGGSTATYKALDETLNRVKKARGSAHHFIMVTDGEATDSDNFDPLTQPFKDRNVVLDVIFLRDRREMQSKPPAVASLEKLAIATGGTVEYVDNEMDMEQKFLQVSERKLLGVGTK